MRADNSAVHAGVHLGGSFPGRHEPRPDESVTWTNPGVASLATISNSMICSGFRVLPVDHREVGGKGPAGGHGGLAIWEP